MEERKGYDPGKNPIIQGLIPGLTERGKIKIGMKGEVRQGGNSDFQLPKKLNHFIVTTLERGKDNNFLKDDALYAALKLPPEPKILPITLLFDEIALNLQCRYTCYFGKTMFCSGDGVAAFQQAAPGKPERKQVACPCYRKEPTFAGDDGKGNGKCKINGCLACMITGANVIGGVWKFRTTGYNSTVGILSSLTLIKTMTGGLLAGIPLHLTIQPKVATNPVDGRAVTIYVVGVEFAGTLADLQNGALQLTQQNAAYRQRLAHVETEVRQLISADAELVDQAGDIKEEFYPPAAELVQPDQLKPEAGTPDAPAPTTAAKEQAPERPGAAPATAPVAEPEKKRRGKKASEKEPTPESQSSAPAQVAAQEPAPHPPIAPLAQPAGAAPISVFD